MFLTLVVSKHVKIFWPILSPKPNSVTTATVYLLSPSGRGLFVVPEFQTLLIDEVVTTDTGYGFNSEEANKDVACN